ncbi:MAG TPA: helix-turn-helix transcriptional regulator [Fimbriimonadaceae bacterium]|nr:helix-turn-helix transcriptional regulator [Fimbriimonadaceae bacterium]
MQERELLKGNIQTLILAILEEEPLHGYGIARAIERRSKAALSFREGSIYPALKALEREGLIASNWETPAIGPARKVYRLLRKGGGELERRKLRWRELVDSIDLVLGGNPDVQPT